MSVVENEIQSCIEDVDCYAKLENLMKTEKMALLNLDLSVESKLFKENFEYRYMAHISGLRYKIQNMDFALDVEHALYNDYINAIESKASSILENN